MALAKSILGIALRFPECLCGMQKIHLQRKWIFRLLELLIRVELMTSSLPKLILDFDCFERFPIIGGIIRYHAVTVAPAFCNFWCAVVTIAH